MPAYKDTERGTWFTSFYFTDWTGKRCVKKKRGFKTKREAQEWEREFLAKAAGESDMTMASLAELYYADMVGRLKETTIRSYAYILRTYILPSFGNQPINQITPAQIRKWQTSMIDKGLATTTIKLIHIALSVIFNYAVKYYKLQSNPCRIAGSVRRSQPSTIGFWTLAEFNKFIDVVKSQSDRAAFLLLYWTGMRIGELLALTLSDFDFEKSTVSITKSYQRLNKTNIITQPKTIKSNRVIPMPTKIIAEVKQYTDMLYGLHGDERVFTHSSVTMRSNMIRYSTIAGVKRIRLHDLRHSHVSLLINQDVPIMLISERLGHENIETTLGVYAHMYPTKAEEMLRKLTALA